MFFSVEIPHFSVLSCNQLIIQFKGIHGSTDGVAAEGICVGWVVEHQVGHVEGGIRGVSVRVMVDL